MPEEIDPFEGTIDEGAESTQPVNDPFDENEPQVDSTEETKQDASTAETGAEDTAEGKEVSTETEATETTEEKPPTEKSPEELLAEVDKEIANDKHPKWYKANLEAVKKAFIAKTETVVEKYKPLESLGDVEKVIGDLEMLNGLTAFENDATGKPAPTTAPFVQKLAERSPDTVFQLFRDIAATKIPDGNATVLEALFETHGIDPKRLEDHRKFAENGYQIGGSFPSEELEKIPEHLREAYASLPQATRDRIAPSAYDDESDIELREQLLESTKFQLDVDREKQQAQVDAETRKAQAEEAAKETFVREWTQETENTIVESDEKITTDFVQSLVNPEVGLTESEALGMALTISAALDGSSALGKQALAALKSQNVPVSEKLGTLFESRNAEARNLAYFKKAQELEPGNPAHKTQYETVLRKFNALSAEIANASTPIIAHFAKEFANTRKARLETNNRLVDSVKNLNTGIGTDGSPHTIGTGTVKLTPAERERIEADPFS